MVPVILFIGVSATPLTSSTGGFPFLFIATYTLPFTACGAEEVDQSI